MKICLQAVKMFRSYTQVGICGHDISIEFDQIFHEQLKVAGSVGYTPAVWQRIIRTLEQRKIKLSGKITHRTVMTDWRTAFNLCEQQQGLKALISPRESIF